MRLLRLGAPRRSTRSSGQTLVEFALVIPIFLTVVVAIAEFSMLFTAFLSASFASRDAAQIAAELGDSAGADGVILRQIERDVSAPVDRSSIKEVHIFQADQFGAPVGSETIYVRGGSTTFTYPGPVTIVVPYTRTANGYPETARCNILASVQCTPSKTTIDTVGIKITYQYSWHTPLPGLLGGGSVAPLITQSNMMRLEPVK